MKKSNINWDVVKDFYLSCRSYKQTAEHFGIKLDTVRTRAYRERWRECSRLTPQTFNSFNTSASHHPQESMYNVQVTFQKSHAQQLCQQVVRELKKTILELENCPYADMEVYLENARWMIDVLEALAQPLEEGSAL